MHKQAFCFVPFVLLCGLPIDKLRLTSLVCVGPLGVPDGSRV